MSYRFPEWKDASWNSYERQKSRYDKIKAYIKKNSVGAELGVYKGGFGEFLLPNCKKLYLVDPWYRTGGFWNSGIENDSRVDTVIDILTKYKAELESGQVQLVVEYAVHFLRSMKDGTFDFLYLDSSHKYEDSRKEIDIALRKMKPGGIILGDDYDPRPESNQYGVYKAVMETVDQGRGELVFVDSRQWGLRPTPADGQ